MPDIAFNKIVWKKMWDWSKGGEEWSFPWGNSEAQWYGTLLPRIHSFLPARNILEIAPGLGRWTRYLLPYSSNIYNSVDINAENCAKLNSELKSQYPNFAAVANNGYDLSAISGVKYDFIFSFDSLVHADPGVLKSYLDQIFSSLLALDGVIFLHVSNMNDSCEKDSEFRDAHWRDRNTGLKLIRKLVENNDGKVFLAEIITWGLQGNKKYPQIHESDILVLAAHKNFVEANGLGDNTIVNHDFMNIEATYIKRILSHYQFNFCSEDNSTK